MEEKVLIKSHISKSVEFVYKCIIIGCAAISILCLLFGIIASISGKNEWKKAALEDAYISYGDHEGEYRCDYWYSYLEHSCGDYFDTADEYFSHLERFDHYSYMTTNRYVPFYEGSGFYALHWVFAVFTGIFYISWRLLANYRLTITDKNVYGITCFGKKITLPIHMISAYATSKFLSAIAITTTSGVIKFSCIGNNDKIAVILQQLINERQEKTSIQESVVAQQNSTNKLDDLMKLKTLLDSNVITQEEFDAKKKEILGI